ncbi:MAG: PilZ domain-containing protein [Planctomycetes bacterium]|nr:PilZ domain-containing protein [Planctomycetota bacterium]
MADQNDIPLLPSHVVAERSHIVIPSLPNWIEPTVEFLRRKAVLGGVCEETRSGKLLIALHEAISNAIIHGNLELSSDLKEQGDSIFAEALALRAADPILANRKVDIVVEFDGDVYRWVITDQGRGFDVDKVLKRCLSDDPEVLLSSGRGILMMKSFLDDVRFEMSGRRVILSLLRRTVEERRKEQRVPLEATFQVTPIGPDGAPVWGETYKAMSRNFSENGISLLQQQLAYAHSVVIGVPTDKGIVHIPAKIRHSQMIGSTGMELGCEFAQPLPPGNPLPAPPPVASPQAEEVHRAVMEILGTTKAQQLPSHERRIHTRVVFHERVTVYIDQRPEPLVCYARDLSKGGLSFIAQQPLPPEISISFETTADRKPLRIRCKVVRCVLIDDGFYDIGAAFQRLDSKGES